VNRREAIALLGSTAVLWPEGLWAQQRPKVARIGFLGTQSAETHRARTAALRAGLRDLGYIEGTNIIL
jgi:putative ABC transport system substrate-binding protein